MRKLSIVFLLSLLVCQLYANSLNEILSKKEIRIGVRKDFPPLGLLKDGKLEGFEILLAEKIGNRILNNQGNVIFVPISGKERIPMLKDNQIDLAIAGMAITQQREEEIDFSIPYLTTNMSIVSKKSEQIKKLSDFKGKTLLVVPGTTSNEYVDKEKLMFSDINIKSCTGLQDCFDKLKSGEADGYFHAVLALGVLPVLDSNYELSVKMVGNTDMVAVGVEKGNTELLKAVNKEILNLAKEDFFKDAYNNTFKVYYRGLLDKKYFLLDDIYNFLMTN